MAEGAEGVLTEEAKRILLTGATGYVGGKLLPELLARGFRVRCLARDPAKLRGLAEGAEAVKGDVLDPMSLMTALDEIDVAYYLVHSMEAGGDFEAMERLAAENFARAAKESKVGRVVYLGGLAHGDDLSPHLASRQATGLVLREGGAPCLEFRASIIIGPGSLSYELVKALVKRLPIMTTPKWVSMRAQPIYIGDVIAYLLAAIGHPLEESKVYEIGGADQVSYLDLMREQARIMGVKRVMVPVPVLTPWLSSLWLALVTPVQARVGMKLIEGVRNESIVMDAAARDDFDISPLGVREALERAAGLD